MAGVPPGGRPDPQYPRCGSGHSPFARSAALRPPWELRRTGGAPESPTPGLDLVFLSSHITGPYGNVIAFHDAAYVCEPTRAALDSITRRSAPASAGRSEGFFYLVTGAQAPECRADVCAMYAYISYSVMLACVV